MRILFFATFFEFRGNQTYYVEEVNSVIENFPDVEYLVYNVNREKNKITRYSKNILWVERKNLRNIKIIYKFLKDMLKVFMKFKPDVIHSCYVIESIIMGFLGKIFRVPTIFHSRGMGINYYPFVSIKSNILARIACLLNNAIITVSQAMKKDSKNLNFPQNKVFTIYDSIDFSNFNPIEKSRYDKGKMFNILNIGRFSFEKCHNIIIETCKNLKENNLKFHLTLIGDGPLKGKIQKLVKNDDLQSMVTFTGWVNHNDIPKYMAKADLYIQPSLTEGMPISVLEAMYMKLPVILSDAGGMPELIQEKGGILIEKNNKEQLYNAILHYINNLDDFIQGGKINNRFISENFIWDKHSRELYELYLKLCKKC